MSNKQNQEAFDKIAITNHWNINKSGNGDYYSTIIQARYEGWLLSINRIESIDAIATELQVTCDKQSKRLAEMIEAKDSYAETLRHAIGELTEENESLE